jgi:hypothetical protein
MAGNPKQARLVAARPAAQHESAAYMPRVHWRILLLGAFSAATVTGGYWISQQHKAEALRAQILRVREEQLAEPARRYLDLRHKLEGLILEAAAKVPDSYADKRLRLAGLRAGKGLYLRLSAKDASSAKGIANGAAAMESDAIAPCLGLAPTSARGLWDKGAFLLPEWIAETRKNDSVMKLRVTDTMLANHIRTDLPTVLNMMRSDWFLLVLEQGENRREHPVDAFLWDLRSGQQLLRGRIQAIGVLLSARISSKDAPRGPGRPVEGMEAATANDCSIAAQLKALAGAEIATVENAPAPSPAPAAEVKPAAAAPSPSKVAAPPPSTP